MSASTQLGSVVLAAWQSLLAAEHAAVFVYRECGPRLPVEDRDLARTQEAAHEVVRDQLSSAILGAGETPVAPLADYPLTSPATGPLTAAAASQACVAAEEAEARAARLLLLAAADPHAGASSATSGPTTPTAATTAGTTTPSGPGPSAPVVPDLVALRGVGQAALSAAAVRAQMWRRRINPDAASVAFPGL